MPAQVTLWRSNGMNKEYPPARDDAGRGQTLLMAMNDATAGDVVVLGPGNYLKPYPHDITKDGVRLHLLPGARIYDTDHPTNLPVINVTSGTHWLSGHGIIEHQGINPGGGSAAAGIFVRDTGTLICEADEIISTTQLNSAVKVADSTLPASPATLYVNTRKQLALDYDALEVGGGTCFARVQHALSPGDADDNAIEVSGNTFPNYIRVIEVQRAESNQGFTLFLASANQSSVSNLHCQSAHALAAVPIRCDSPAEYTRLGHVSAVASNSQTVQLVTGRLIADQIEHNSTAPVTELQINTKLFAHYVVNTLPNTNGIKVLNTYPDLEPIVDVGQIQLQATGEFFSVFADTNDTFFAMIRNFRSPLPIALESPPLTDNHP